MNEYMYKKIDEYDFPACTESGELSAIVKKHEKNYCVKTHEDGTCKFLRYEKGKQRCVYYETMKDLEDTQLVADFYKNE